MSTLWSRPFLQLLLEAAPPGTFAWRPRGSRIWRQAFNGGAVRLELHCLVAPISLFAPAAPESLATLDPAASPVTPLEYDPGEDYHIAHVWVSPAVGVEAREPHVVVSPFWFAPEYAGGLKETQLMAEGRVFRHPGFARAEAWGRHSGAIAYLWATGNLCLTSYGLPMQKAGMFYV